MGYAQNSFKILERAENSYHRGMHKKALRQIKKAENTSYCTCGTCSFQVTKKSNLLRYHIYSSLKKYQLARNHLDSIDLAAPVFDSLKIVSYQAQFGKDFLAKTIDYSLENSAITCNGENYFIEMQLKGKQSSIRLKLPLTESYSCIYNNAIEKEKIKENWIERFKKSSLYSLTTHLMQNSMHSAQE
jgi:hypothetical protein